jgi:hypothetical protein
MFTVRDVLDRLPKTALVHLAREKGMSIRGRVDELRVGLARHYGRRVADLLRGLRRADLYKLFRRSIEVGGTTYRLRNRSRIPKEALLDIALALFVRGEVSEALTSETVVDEDVYEEDEEDEESDEDEGEEDEEQDGDEEKASYVKELDDILNDLEGASAREGIDVNLPRAIQATLGRLEADGWSNARPLARLLSQMYDQAFVRLRTKRFHQLLSDLHAYGVELCLADDPEHRPLLLGAESPGLDVRVRIRRRPARTPLPREVPRVVSPPPPAPPAVPAAPVLPVRVVPDPVPRAPLGPPLKMTPYELALLRLEFLTATPCAARGHDPMWPDAFLDAATRGLDLDDRSLRYLRLAARSFVSGSHDAMGRVTRLTRALHADEWPLLLLDFERLNPEADPDAVASVVRYASELASIPTAPVATVAPPAPSHAPRPHPTHAPPRAASPRLAASPPQGGDRNLGPLKNMFDD